MPEDRQIGVLIDYENVGLGSVPSLFDQLSDIGRIIVKRGYADWTKAGGRGEQMTEMGIEPRQHFHAPGAGKNASDIHLAIEAIELLHRSPVDTFVIVSSDTDFVPLVTALRSAGKMVIGAGRRGVVSPSLVNSCDRYFFLDEGKPTARDHSVLKNQAESLLGRAMEASTGRSGPDGRGQAPQYDAADRPQLRLQGFGTQDLHAVLGLVTSGQDTAAPRARRCAGRACRGPEPGKHTHQWTQCGGVLGLSY